nr:immunoglobulin light chain junction region [Macaca mulatta]MOX21782.1 immunoglobulin light chain junction region [Macaca mulatta]MOX81285.1 immunoglobulin light chain junction region [Macaca mulatta]MOY05228.1 immunoglobulin light chain junction region [Macaca mulatta]MOY05585.1 immunoglobulin light chain junction region [Macaca mulatta]
DYYCQSYDSSLSAALF